jgi:hypothetical protein
VEFEVGVGQVILLNMSAPGRVAKVTAVSPWAVAAVVYRELPALRWSEERFPTLVLDPSPDDDPEIVAVDPGTFWGWISQHVAYTGISYDEFTRSAELVQPRIPKITAEQWQQLSRIEASSNGRVEYRPVRVVLAGGTSRDHVVFAEASQWISTWGRWPAPDHHVGIEEVTAILETNDRLPAALATRLYEAGESSMGGTSFAVVMRDGRRFAVSTGNLVDLVELPSEVSPSDVIDVIPHDRGEGLPQLGSAHDYAWCLYRH